jgi:sugar-specific transcriptional regulator TrmB
VPSKSTSTREEGIQLFTKLGLSPTQAKIYMHLLEMGQVQASALSQSILLPRSEVYRILSELQQKGLVEKEVNYPNRFTATPIEIGLQILLINKSNQYAELKKNINDFIQEAISLQEKTTAHYEYKINIIEGKERILQKIAEQHDNAQKSAKILTTLPRWLQIIQFCIKNYNAALARGVEYRIILENFDSKIMLPKEVLPLLKKPNFKLRISKMPLESNGAIFDRKIASINFFPGKSLSDSPFIYTNHPSLISMLEDQFEKIWNTSDEYN